MYVLNQKFDSIRISYQNFDQLKRKSEKKKIIHVKDIKNFFVKDWRFKNILHNKIIVMQKK